MIPLEKRKQGAKKILFGFSNIVLVLLMTFLFISNAFSQEGGRRIALTPLTFELRAEQGGRTGEYIRVMNPSYEESISILMESEDMFPEGEEGRITLQATEEDLDVIAMSRWVTFEPEEFVLNPREEKNVRFTIDVPENAQPGGYYAGMIAGTPPDDTTGTGVGVVHRIASLVLLTVPGEMKEELSAIGIDTLKTYYEHGPVTFVSRFENTGTVHLMPDAHITVRNILGQEVAVVPIEKRNVLPGAVRRLETEWNIDWLWGGVYTATVEGSYGELSDSAINPQAVTFFAFPWKAGIVIVFIVLFFILTRKRWATIFRILIKGEAGLSQKTEEE